MIGVTGYSTIDNFLLYSLSTCIKNVNMLVTVSESKLNSGQVSLN